MEFTNFLFFLILACQGFAYPSGGKLVVARADTNATVGGIKVDFTVKLGPKKGAALGNKALEKRTLKEGLANQGNAYFADFTFGSQKDSISGILDTGSSDIFVIAPYAQCTITNPSQAENYCLQYGTYDPSDSTTSVDQYQDFSISYGIGVQGASGEYYLDNIIVSGVTVDNAIFAVVNVTSTTPSVFGIGLEANEAVTEDENDYVNFSAQLVQQGLISRNYYSLYLDSPSASTGSIIFGGSDPSKYSGELVALPLQNNAAFFVTLNSFTASGFSYKTDYPVLLDSGTTITLLPQGTVDSIAKLFPDAEYSESVGLYHVSGYPDGDLSYNFNGVTIKIPFSALVEPGEDYGASSGYWLDLAYSNTNVLGDNFLRWAYLVYDLDNLEVSIAQSVFS